MSLCVRDPRRVHHHDRHCAASTAMASAASTAPSVIRTTAGCRSTFRRWLLFSFLIKAVITYRLDAQILVCLFFLGVFCFDI